MWDWVREREFHLESFVTGKKSYLDYSRNLLSMHMRMETLQFRLDQFEHHQLWPIPLKLGLVEGIPYRPCR